jgi:aminoglycoside 6'-N-acetyltransferase I
VQPRAHAAPVAEVHTRDGGPGNPLIWERMPSPPLPGHFQVLPLADLDLDRRSAVASVLRDAFALWPDSWRTLESAREEVEQSLEPDRISLVGLAGDEAVGWIGGISLYGGRVWELHPLAVRADCQGRGVGKALVLALEDAVRARGGLTIYLGTDDVSNLTSLGGVDLYPAVLDKLGGLENLRRHPFGFYLRLGFEVVGVVPDANGFGRPDIMMAKRVAR